AGYMAPEQLKDAKTVDARSDVFALGAILYEILCGQRTVAKGRLRDMLNDIIAGQIKPVRTHNASVPKSIESVALKALQRDPHQRYQSALEMAADVDAFLADEPVSTYRDPWHVRFRRLAQKHRTLVTSSVAAVTVAIGAIWLTSVVESRRMDGVRLQVETMLRDAESTLAKQQLTIQNFNEADQLLRSADTLLATEPDLGELRSDVESQLTDVTRLRTAHVANRLANLRLAVERKVAETATLQGRDPAEARTRLTALVTQLRQEPALAPLLKSTEHRLTVVNQSIADRKTAAAARTQFATFSQHVEDARFNGSLFSGNTVDQDTSAARQQAQQALDIYDLAGDQPPRLRPPHLTAIEHTQIRRDAFEMLLVLAECEVTLARNSLPEQQAVAARSALVWLARAQRLNVPTRVLHLRRAAYLNLLGQNDQRDAERARADQQQLQLALDHFLQGESDRKLGNFQNARTHYRAALTIDPQHFWSNQQMGLCHLRTDDFPAAVASYTQCVAQRPNFAWTYVVRAVAFTRLSQFDDAQTDFDKSLRLAPDSIAISYAVHVNRGRFALEQDRFAESQHELEQAIAARPTRPAAYIHLGELHRKQGNAVAQSGKRIAAVAFYRRALEHLTKATEWDPRDPNPYRVRADVLRRLDDPTAAISDLEQAAQLAYTTEKRADDFLTLGDIAFHNRQLSEALKYYEQSLTLNGSNATALRRQAEVLIKMRRPREAIASFSRYLKHGDPLGDVYRARALASAEIGEYRNAMNDYTRSLELEPSPNMLVRRGWAYLTQANRLALQDFEDAVRLNPQSADSYTGRGYARVLNGQIEAGVADARTSLKWARLQSKQMGPRSWPLMFNAATIFGQAVAHIERSSPDSNPKAQQQIDDYTAEAVRLLEETLRLAGPQLASRVRSQMAADSALDALRNKPAFKRLTTASPDK
ncbi:MAG: tetratricopeptide repeat protein, partial [Planctomycetaceae bacterium]